MYDLQAAHRILSEGQYTCVLCRGNDTVTDSRRGVKPLLELLESGRAFAGYSAADKVVGKAAAFLYCLLGVAALHAGVISQPALAVLEDAGITVRYDTLVPAIRNRTNTGFCPMETAVWDIANPALAPEAIRTALKNLQA